MAAKTFREDPRRQLLEKLAQKPAKPAFVAEPAVVEKVKPAIDPKTIKPVKKEEK
jgi:hypothetical protein